MHPSGRKRHKLHRTAAPSAAGSRRWLLVADTYFFFPLMEVSGGKSKQALQAQRNKPLISSCTQGLTPCLIWTAHTYTKCTSAIVKILQHVQIIGKAADRWGQKCYLSYIPPNSDNFNDKKKSITFNLILLYCFLLHPTTSIHASIYGCYPFKSEAGVKLKSESQESNRLLAWRNEPMEQGCRLSRSSFHACLTNLLQAWLQA